VKEKTERNVEKRKIKIKGKIKGNEREAGESNEVKCKNMSIALNGEKSFLKENTVGGGRWDGYCGILTERTVLHLCMTVR
jgi:hypothetical protein